ncbi:lipocalin-like domain-containing protein [Luteirhabdus pelagi]|uniref:lipocalin-like domain-containing protein n=1 Tax=Luteirhabdus pelagi TaxID=2792783 RepID=UPI00193A6788|nr:lipocalin-like domain-containing protein [Luteirhabdus pelagi]
MKILSLLLACVIAISCNAISEEKSQAPTKSLEETLSGLWSLQAMEVTDSVGNWKQWRDGMGGYLLYGESGYMSLHLWEKGYEKTDLRFPNFTDTIPLKALQHLTGSYVYIGDYSLNKKDSIVSHKRLSHSNPGDWGKTVQRRFSFNGDTLVIRPVEKANASLRLKWLKEE